MQNLTVSSLARSSALPRKGIIQRLVGEFYLVYWPGSFKVPPSRSLTISDSTFGTALVLPRTQGPQVISR